MHKTYAKVIFIIFFVGILIFRLALINVNKGLWWDEAVYLTLGKNLLAGSYGMNEGMERFRPPFFPFLVGLASIGGEFSVKILMVFLTILALLATYWLGKVTYGKEVGCFALVFVATSPLFLFFGHRILVESTFIIFFSISLATFYLGIEKRKRYLLFSGFFTGLTILTKYQGASLLIIYTLYLLLTGNIKILKSKEGLAAVVIFILSLTPLFFIGLLYYNNPIGGILENMKIFEFSSREPTYFYLVNLFSIFNFPLIFLFFGLFFSLKDMKSEDKLFLISSLLPIFLLSLQPHKELRYFTLFLPAFACISGKGISNLFKEVKNYKNYIAVATLFIFSLSFLRGYWDVVGGGEAGESLKLGALTIKNLTTFGEKVMSESYPYINYYAERVAIRPLPTKEEFYSLLDKHNITYVLIYVFEKGNPPYLLEELENSKNFEEVESFYEWGEKATIIYKKVNYFFPSERTSNS